MRSVNLEMITIHPLSGNNQNHCMHTNRGNKRCARELHACIYAMSWHAKTSCSYDIMGIYRNTDNPLLGTLILSCRGPMATRTHFAGRISCLTEKLPFASAGIAY